MSLIQLAGCFFYVQSVVQVTINTDFILPKVIRDRSKIEKPRSGLLNLCSRKLVGSSPQNSSRPVTDDGFCALHKMTTRRANIPLLARQPQMLSSHLTSLPLNNDNNVDPYRTPQRTWCQQPARPASKVRVLSISCDFIVWLWKTRSAPRGQFICFRKVPMQVSPWGRVCIAKLIHCSPLSPLHHFLEMKCLERIDPWWSL